MVKRQDKIDRKYIVLCEGIDAVNFLIQYLNSDVLIADSRFNKDIQVLNFGGIRQLYRYIKNLKKMDNFMDVKRILVLRDAETDINSAVDSVQSALRNNDLPVPDRCNQWKLGESLGTAFTLFPNCSGDMVEGTLEDLCWNILADKRAAEYRIDVQAFIEEIDNKYDSIKTFKHKSRLHAYFSAKDDFVSLKIGEAAKAKAFDWAHERLRSLRNLIEEGFEG